jgi:hypothetical protein
MPEPTPEPLVDEGEPTPDPVPEIPVYTAPQVEPPPNPGVEPSRGEQGGDGG